MIQRCKDLLNILESNISLFFQDMLLELIVQGLIDRSSIDNSAIDFTPGDKKNFACTGATRLLYSKKNSKESRCKEKSNHPVSFNLVRDLKVICLYSRNSILFLLLRSFSLVVKLYVSFSYYHLVPSNRKRKKNWSNKIFFWLIDIDLVASPNITHTF